MNYASTMFLMYYDVNGLYILLTLRLLENISCFYKRDQRNEFVSFSIYFSAYGELFERSFLFDYLQTIIEQVFELTHQLYEMIEMLYM